jgi:hypothetical protein
MLKFSYDAHCKEHFSEQGIMTVFSLYVFKVVLSKMSTLPKNENNHNTRNRYKFQFVKQKKEIVINKPSYIGVHFF